MDRMIIWNHESTDNTQAILEAHPKVEVRTWSTGGVYHTPDHTKMKNNVYKNTGPGWKIVVDADEFLWHPRINEVLDRYEKIGVSMPKTLGFDMVAERLPEDDGHTPLTDLVKEGMFNGSYAKFCIFKHFVTVVYDHGCHTCRAANATISKDYQLRLLHYRWFDIDRLVARAAAWKENLSEEARDMGLSYMASNPDYAAKRWHEVWNNKARVIP